MPSVTLTWLPRFILYFKEAIYVVIIRRVGCVHVEVDNSGQPQGEGRNPDHSLQAPTFATRPFTLLTLADTILLHLVAVRTTGADAGAMICHHIVP